MIQQQRRQKHGDKAGSSSSLTKLFLQVADRCTVQQLIDIAFLFRIFILICMALTCFMFPKYLFAVVSDDDTVATFPLRLLHSHSPMSDEIIHHFALPNSICTSILRHKLVIDVRHGINFKLQENNYINAMIVSSHSSHIWSFLLTPLTRWDAARFLRIAHDPAIRYPQLQYQLHSSISLYDATDKIDGYITTPDSNVTTQSSCPNIEQILQQSEEAHAFLPLYPLMIKIMVAILLWCTPISKLPSTCEGVVVLAAYLFNTVCYLWSAKQLYNMTKLLLVDCNRNTTQSADAPIDESERWARRVLLLYIINPATIFFNTSYSESFAAALIFTGYHWILCYRIVTPSVSYLIGTWLVWYLSCFVRSNGMLNAGFLILFGIGGFMRNMKSLRRLLTSTSITFSSVLLVVGSLGLYNYHAYRKHCWIDLNALITDNDLVSNDCSLLNGYRAPEWCQYGPSFNVYSFVQRKYWNVGLFRYYEWKQLPNFILAAPVLYCSICAVFTWIKINWERYSKLEDTKNRGTLHVWQQLVGWSISSLQLFADIKSTGTLAKQPSAMETKLLGDPILLGHYAVLAASVIIGITMTHIQITTRMIFSTCPALYWYLIVLISKCGRFGDAVVFWCLLYIILGLVMHPNWLPWT
jgi:GPI mannosyltransferase 2